jgi:hypothetical protein
MNKEFKETAYIWWKTQYSSLKKKPATILKRTYLESLLRRVKTPTADGFTTYLQDPIIHISEGGINLF